MKFLGRQSFLSIFPNGKNTQTPRTREVLKESIFRDLLDDLGESVQGEHLESEAEKKVWRDAVVVACVNSRKAVTLKKEVRVVCEKEAIQAEFLKVFSFEILDQILDAPYQGMAVFEINWHEQEGLLFPELVERNYRDFSFKQGRLCFKRNGLPEPVPPFKALCLRHRAKHNQPLGEALIQKLFYPVKFSNASLSFWLRFLEKFGAPWSVGRTDTDKNRMAKEIHKMLSGDTAVLNSDDELELVFGTKVGDFDKLVEYCDNKKREIILGGNLTGEVKGGSFAAAQVHQQVREDLALSDRALVKSAFAQVRNAFLAVNGLELELAIHLKDEDDPQLQLAERDQRLVSLVGVLEEDYIERTYQVRLKTPQNAPETIANSVQGKARVLAKNATGSVSAPFKAPLNNSPENTNTKPRHSPLTIHNSSLASMSESTLPVDEIERHLEKLDTQTIEEELQAKIEAIFSNAHSYAEAENRLLEAYPHLHLQTLEDALFAYLANSEIQGRAEIETEKNNKEW